MPLEGDLSGYRVQLATEAPRKEALLPLKEFAALLSIPSVPPDVQLTAANQNHAVESKAVEAMALRVAALEARIASLAEHQAIPRDDLPKFLGGSGNGEANELISTIERIVALENAIDAIEQRMAENAHQPQPEPQPVDHPADDALPSFLRKEQDNRAAEIEQIRHDIANLHQQFIIIDEMLRRKLEPPPAPPVRDMARMDIINAGRRRRAAAAPEGDVARMLILENTALLAQSGQEAAFSLMSVLAEANGMAAADWGQIASRIIKDADKLKHVTVRTTAVETKALAEVTMAETDEMAQRIARGAVEAIGAIEG